MRRLMESEHFVEVETPILQPQAGGAIARPFFTHANALDIDLSLRIAPELYLKRLVVGGFERVFEIARNFRNEGVSTRHSPEFTALEAYRAFGDVNDGMDLTEALVLAAAERGHRPHHVRRRRRRDRPGRPVAPAPAARRAGGAPRPAGPPDRPGRGAAGGVRGARRHPAARVGAGQAGVRALRPGAPARASSTRCSLVGFPVEVSPLARHTADDPTMADRFELCIVGREFANGYSELNVPEEQAERFEVSAAAKAGGDAEAHPADQAFVRALRVRAAPDRRHRHRHRPADHAAGRGRGHPRRDPLPDAAPRGRRLTRPAPRRADRPT